jgi:hypothetical protein
MGEEIRIVLNLLAEKKITVEEAEQLLAALEGETETVSEAQRTDADSVSTEGFPERLSKVFTEMVDAGQELPGRLSRAMESLFGGFGWGYRGVSVERCFNDGTCSPGSLSMPGASSKFSICGDSSRRYSCHAQHHIPGKVASPGKLQGKIKPEPLRLQLAFEEELDIAGYRRHNLVGRCDPAGCVLFLTSLVRPDIGLVSQAD